MDLRYITPTTAPAMGTCGNSKKATPGSSGSSGSNRKPPLASKLQCSGTKEGTKETKIANLIPGFVFPAGPKDVLGTGAYAEVYTILEEKSKVALAVKIMKPESTLELDIVDRDAYFLHALQTMEPLMVPKLVTVHRTPKQVSLVMERMSGNVHTLMAETRRQFKKLHPSWNDFEVPSKILREQDLWKILGIVDKLNKHHIVHGDLSLSQFLFHVQDARIVLTDFGFAGWSIQDSKHLQCPILGWPVNTPKCAGLGFGNKAEAQVIDTTHPLREMNLLPYLNWWELDANLWLEEVYIWRCRENQHFLKRFGRVSNSKLSKEIEDWMYTKCCSEQQQKYAQRKQFLKQQPELFYWCL